MWAVLHPGQGPAEAEDSGRTTAVAQPWRCFQRAAAPASVLRGQLRLSTYDRPTVLVAEGSAVSVMRIKEAIQRHSACQDRIEGFVFRTELISYHSYSSVVM